MTLTLPDWLMLGWGGFAPAPWLLVLSKKHARNGGLLAHERCHQAQQRRDGWLTFMWRYATSKPHRLAYELEAYRVWLRLEPQRAHIFAAAMADKYDLGVSYIDAYALLMESEK